MLNKLPVRAGTARSDQDLRALIWSIMKRLPAYTRLGWRLIHEPAVPGQYKALIYGAVVYAATPVHTPLTPIPIVGQIDTPLVLLLSLRSALAHCPAPAAERHLRALKLSATQLDEDLAALRHAAREAAHSTSRSVRFAARVAAGFTRRVVWRLTQE
jgi:hypothetical protein